MLLLSCQIMSQFASPYCGYLVHVYVTFHQIAIDDELMLVFIFVVKLHLSRSLQLNFSLPLQLFFTKKVPHSLFVKKNSIHFPFLGWNDVPWNNADSHAKFLGDHAKYKNK